MSVDNCLFLSLTNRLITILKGIMVEIIAVIEDYSAICDVRKTRFYAHFAPADVTCMVSRHSTTAVVFYLR